MFDRKSDEIKREIEFIEEKLANLDLLHSRDVLSSTKGIAELVQKANILFLKAPASDKKNY